MKSNKDKKPYYFHMRLNSRADDFEQEFVHKNVPSGTDNVLTLVETRFNRMQLYF